MHLKAAPGKFVRVYCFSYGNIKNLPDGIVQREAEDVLPFALHQKLMDQNRRIQHLADAGRLLAIELDNMGGWSGDCDVCWLNAVPDLPLHEEPFFGHWAATLDLHRSTQMSAEDKLA